MKLVVKPESPLVIAAPALIQSVDILGANNNTVVSGQEEQFVNLPATAAFVDNTNILHQNQLTKNLKVKVKFDKPGVHHFKIKMVPDASNCVYSATEIARNSNFKHQDQELSMTTDANGEKIIAGNHLFVSAAGADKFKVSASDAQANSVVSAGEVLNKRMFYLVEAKMQGLTSIASNLNIAEAEYEKHGIDFTILPAVNIPHMPNIGNRADKSQFKNSVISAYSTSQGPSKGKFGITVAYTDHLAVKATNKRVPKYNVTGGSASPINMPIEDSNHKSKSLWNNIVPGEDWFVSCYFLKNGGNPSTDKIIIPKSKCTPIQKVGAATDNCNYVDIDVSWLPVETGTVYLYVNWVGRMRGGLAFGGTNIVAICTRAWWKNISTQTQNVIVIHELGHKFNMASDGDATKKLPDAIPNYYYQKGGHCHAGVTVSAGTTNYHKRSFNLSASCIMFGMTKRSRSGFCSDCSIAIKKVDLKGGV